jgi:PKHD-type hydroxylase
MRQNWQMWSGGLSDTDLSIIFTEALKLNTQSATTFNNADTSVRSSDVAWLSGNTAVQDILWKYVKAANENAFYCQVENICDIQFTEYHSNKGGHYDWHIDVNWDGDDFRDRKLSVTVQLSDPSEYEGGGFEFAECQTPDASSRQKGTVLVFPSYLQHRVLPITSGTRKSLVAWFEGPRWQ